MLNVVLFCGELHGHEPGYLRHAGRALTSLPGVQLTVVLPIGARSFRENQDFRFIDDLGAELDFQIPPLPGRGFQNAAGRLRSLTSAINRHRADYVFIPTGDLLVQAVASWRVLPFLRPTASPVIDAIVHACRFAYAGGDTLRRLKNVASLQLLARSPAESIKLLSFDAVEHLRRKVPALASRFEMVPHPVAKHISLSKFDARMALGVPTGGRVVGCVGQIDERKGVDLLLRAFSTSHLHPTDYLLLVGRVSSAIERLIRAEYQPLVKQGRLVVRNGFVAEEEMGAAICAMDLVCLPYRAQYGVASVILNANSLGRPVLSSAIGWPLVAVNRFGLGATCNVFDAPEFAAAIERSLDAAQSFQSSSASRILAQYHSPENFTAHVTRKPREMLNLPPQDGFLPWHAVEM